MSLACEGEISVRRKRYSTNTRFFCCPFSYSFSFVCVSWTKFVWNAASEGVKRNAFSLAVGHNNIIRALLLIILGLR